MHFTQTPEDKLFPSHVSITGKSQTVQQLIRLDLDWSRVFETVVNCGVAPLVYSRLKQATNSSEISRDFAGNPRRASTAVSMVRNSLRQSLSQAKRHFGGLLRAGNPAHSAKRDSA